MTMRRKIRRSSMIIEQIQAITLQSVMTIFTIFSFVIYAMISSIPFYYGWNYMASIYFNTYIPPQFLHFGYWHVVSFSLICTFLGQQIDKIIPHLFSKGE